MQGISTARQGEIPSDIPAKDWRSNKTFPILFLTASLARICSSENAFV